MTPLTKIAGTNHTGMTEFLYALVWPALIALSFFESNSPPAIERLSAPRTIHGM
jgi:hypothetical protein